MRKVFIIFITSAISIAAAAQTPYNIYPTPHRQDLTEEKVSFTNQVNLISGKDIDEATIKRAEEILKENGLQVTISKKAMKDLSTIVLGVNGSQDDADKAITGAGLDKRVFELEKYDRHILSLTGDKKGNAEVVILGENTDAVFCGLASLEQILEGGKNNLNCVNIFDYADIQHRGIIEGYYGVPYSAEVTKDIFRFMAKYKMNTYMYGAKSDPYHSQYWSYPYPESITEDQERIGYLSRDMLSGITRQAHASKVDFIWAIHPGTAFTDPDYTDVNELIMDKFEYMYSLGVRQFGVFVDDCGVPSDPASLKLDADRLTELQGLIDKKWNNPGSAPEDMVKPLHYVPQLYAYSWVRRDVARKFFESLRSTPEKVNIYITGQNVWSVPNNTDLEVVEEFLGREVSWWWNYPCNDNDMTKIFTMDIYSNFKDESHIDNLARLEVLKGTNTVIINPMQQGEISKITLFSVADYTWNMAQFNNDQSYQAAIKAVGGKQYAQALSLIAPYLRYYDADALEYAVKNYKTSVEQFTPRPNELISKLNDVFKACCVIETMKNSANQSDRLFYDDLRPWLLKLKAMSMDAIQLLKGNSISITDYENNPDFQFEVLTGMGEDITLSTRIAEPAAQVLMPFIDWLRARSK